MINLRRSVAPLSLAVLALGAVACNKLDDSVPRENYGIVFADASRLNDTYVLDPTASFFSSPELVFNTSVQSVDTCVDAPYSATANDNLQGLRFLDAGESLTAALSGATRQLTKVTEPNSTEQYKIATGGGITYTPGDSLLMTIPGGTGFPAFTLKAKTAEAFTRTDPAPPAVGEGLTLAWSAASQSGSTMLVSLRYAAAGSATLNRQVYCDLVDDGSYNIAASTITGWRASTLRENVFTRWRTELKQLDTDTYALVSATLSVPTPGSEPNLSRGFNLFAAR